jgi:heme A synthase
MGRYNLNAVKSFRSLAVAAAALAFFLAVLGSWVRINGAGMTCPDWPLCNGSLIPRFDGGVIYEWSHRLVALIEGFILIGAVICGFRVRKSIADVSPVLGVLAVVFLLQVALGGITVQLSNRPDSVVYHWAAAMALLATLTTLAVLSIIQPSTKMRLTPVTIALSVAALTCVAAMCAGAYVSSSGAGLACVGIPGCGNSFWGSDLLQHAQMIHRGLAAVFFVTALIATGYTTFARRGSAAATAAGIGFVLVLVQISLGFANVLALLPIGLREAHAANAAATFLAYVIAAVLDALDAGAPNRLGDAAFNDSPRSSFR